MLKALLTTLKVIKLSFLAILGLILVSCNQTIPSNLSTVPENIGLYGEYFGNNDFTGVRRSQIDAEIKFSWGTGSPALYVPSDAFSARWTGYLHVPSAGSYSFALEGEGKTKLTLNGNAISNGEKYNLSAGKHSIAINYIKTTQHANLHFKWSHENSALKTVSTSSLSVVEGIDTESLIAQAETNLVLNGDFEDELSNWLTQGNVFTVKRLKDKGSKALKAAQGGVAKQEIPLSFIQEGKTYKIEATGSTEGRCEVAVKGFKETSDQTKFNKRLAITRPSEQFKAATITIPEGVARVEVSIQAGESNPNCTVDNVAFTRVVIAPSTSNIIKNGDFEDGFKNWIRIADSDSTKIIEPEDSRTGKAVELSNGATVVQEISISFEAGQPYQLSALGRTVFGPPSGSFCSVSLATSADNSDNIESYSLPRVKPLALRSGVVIIPEGTRQLFIKIKALGESKCIVDNLSLTLLNTDRTSSNLVLNGGFEGNFDHWSLNSGRFDQVITEVIKPGQGGSSQAARFLQGTFPQARQVIPSSAIEVGATYRISAFGRNLSENPNGACEVKAISPRFIKTLAIERDNWQYKAKTITIPEGVGDVTIQVNALERPCDIDNIAFEKVDGTPIVIGLLVQNGRFEEGEKNWATFSGKSEIVKGKSGDGLALSSFAWVQQDLKSPNAGSTYSFTADMKSNTGCTMGVWGGTRGKVTFNEKLFRDNSPSDWKRFQRNVSLPDDVVWATVYTASNKDCTIDNVQFAQVPD